MKSKIQSTCKTPVSMENSNENTERIAEESVEGNVGTIQINKDSEKTSQALLSKSSDLGVVTSVLQFDNIGDYNSTDKKKNCVTTSDECSTVLNGGTESKANISCKIADNLPVPIEQSFCSYVTEKLVQCENKKDESMIGKDERNKFKHKEKWKNDAGEHQKKLVGENEDFHHTVHQEGLETLNHNDTFEEEDNFVQPIKFNHNDHLVLSGEVKETSNKLGFEEEKLDRDREENPLLETDEFEFRSNMDKVAHLPFKKRRICTSSHFNAEHVMKQDEEISYPQTPMISIAEVALTTPYLLSLYSGFPNTYEQFSANDACDSGRIAYVVPSKGQSKDYYQYVEK